MDTEVLKWSSELVNHFKTVFFAPKDRPLSKDFLRRRSFYFSTDWKFLNLSATRGSSTLHFVLNYGTCDRVQDSTNSGRFFWDVYPRQFVPSHTICQGPSRTIKRGPKVGLQTWWNNLLINLKWFSNNLKMFC